MTGQEKHTRLTLDEMIRRSEQVKEAKSKNKTKELYVESLGGTITITKPTSCLLYTSPSPRDGLLSRMPSSA